MMYHQDDILLGVLGAALLALSWIVRKLAGRDPLLQTLSGAFLGFSVIAIAMFVGVAFSR
jgi:hypothetical protein